MPKHPSSPGMFSRSVRKHIRRQKGLIRASGDPTTEQRRITELLEKFSPPRR